MAEDFAYITLRERPSLMDMAAEWFQGITPVYLVTDHTGFYEHYGWEFLTMVQGNCEPYMSRMYRHK